MDRQLALDVHLKDFCSFDNFLPGRNRELLANIRQLADGIAPSRVTYVWGTAGSGKTHLLQAACRRVAERGEMPVYIPLRDHGQLSTAVFEGLHDCALVCLDDIDAIAGKSEWEHALMALYEDLGNRVPLLVAARNNARNIGLTLPDLVTRLASGLVYQLVMLDDEDKLLAIQQRAQARGFELAEDAGRYVLNRYPRDTHALFALLDRLDKGSLAEQRRVTIPFIKSLESAG